MTENKKCPKCGEILNEDWPICPYCGNSDLDEPIHKTKKVKEPSTDRVKKAKPFLKEYKDVIIGTSIAIIMILAIIIIASFYGMDNRTYNYNEDTLNIVNEFKIINNELISYNGRDTVVEIPDGITKIGEGAFRNNYKLEVIIIPDGVTSIGNCAFSSCTNLNDVEIPSSVTDIGFSAFAACFNLEQIVIPSSVETIGVTAFRNCNNLKILCEAKKQPDGWDENWNSTDCPVEWNYKEE